MLPSIAQHAALHKIHPLKKYGQNFIFDSSLCDKIVRASKVKSGDHVLEIGPGTAGLTRSILLASPASLTVIEKDSRCIQLLTEIKALYSNLHIIEQDALKFNLYNLHKNQINIISNLPYNIGSELLIQWLQSPEIISSITIMLQKEVVDRICAKSSTKEYGRLSIICQLICDVNKCFNVSAKAFYPPPKIQSAIVNLIPKKEILQKEIIHSIEHITKLAFGSRRKMLKTSLKNLHPDIEKWLNTLCIDKELRAENLSPAQYLLLARYYSNNTGN